MDCNCCKEFKNFTKLNKLVHDDILEKICNIVYDGKDGDGIKVYSKDNLDREGANYKAYGEITLGKITYLFEIEDGNWNGTAITGWYIYFKTNKDWLYYLKTKLKELYGTVF